MYKTSEICRHKLLVGSKKVKYINIVWFLKMIEKK